MVPSHKYLGHLWAEMRIWLSIINSEAENFAGDNLVMKLDVLKHLSDLVEKWTGTALEVFSRHKRESSRAKRGASGSKHGSTLSTTDGGDGGRGSVGVASEAGRGTKGGETEGEDEEGGEERNINKQYNRMIQLKRAVDANMAMYSSRAAGENGE